ncbi:MAG: TIGR02302 family protein [Alphaproteobacteria bacterium]|nr:TIGR02302 family protein [Alphaproteobacteria bacterium]
MDKTTFPTGSPEGPAEGFPFRVEARIWASRIALTGETVWPLLWPALGIIAVFTGLSLFEFWALVPAWAHASAIILSVMATLIALAYSFEDFVLPARADAIRRLERTNRLEHRPLIALEDRPAAPIDGAAAQLWRIHRQRMAERLKDLVIALPRSLMSGRDPNALRVLAALFVAAGLIASGSDAPRRFLAGFAPRLTGSATLPVTLDAWITPPAYTRQPPVMLKAESEGPAVIDVPAGSILTLRVQNTPRAPRISASPISDGAPVSLPEARAIGPGTFEATGPLTQSMMLQVSAGGLSLSQWAINVIPDRAPQIAFAAPPSFSPRGALQFQFTARDDYGLASAEAEIVLDIDAVKEKGLAEAMRAEGTAAPLTFPLPMPAQNAKDRPLRVSKDFTSHRWAGLPVLLTLKAADSEGQTGTSETVPLVLPERAFNNPLAQALIEQRKKIILTRVSVPKAIRVLDALTLAPELFFEDGTLYLGMRVAARRLESAREDKDFEAVENLLFDLALRAEDGERSLAESRLRDLMQQLSQALENGASEQEIAALMDELRGALEEYLQSMAENPPAGGSEGDAREISPEDLARMLDAIENMARQGSRDSARDMLAELQHLLDNLQAGSPQGEASPEQQAMTKALEDLSALLGRQRELMDDTFQEQTKREGAAPSDPRRRAPANPELESRQKGLQQDLDAIQKQLEGAGVATPENLPRAGEHMGKAEDNLGTDELPGALKQQQQAIDRLRESLQDMAQQLAQQQGRQPGKGTGAGRGRQAGRDPFGRETGTNGSAFEGDVQVPSEREMQRAREILEELQRRAGERGRPEPELDYLERLLRRF